MSSFRKVFRLIFVFFFLYLMGDAFYRWDGFRYYASFSDFLPGLALVSIFWSIVAVLVTIIAWLLLNIVSWICRCVKLQISSAGLMLNTAFLIASCAAVWASKEFIWPAVQITREEKIMVAVSAVLLSVFLTWLLRHKAERLMDAFSERITPLVWLFGIWILISMFLVGYQTWIVSEDKADSQVFIESSEEDNKSLPNIILVTFDALSARNMSVYGYSRPTTPFIEKWAEQASVFTQTRAASNFTAPTTASLMTGKRVWSHLRLSRMFDSRPVGSKIENLPFLLKQKGYYLMNFIQNPSASVTNLKVSAFFDITALQESLIDLHKVDKFIRLFLLSAFERKIKLYDWLVRGDFIFGKFLNIAETDYTVTVSRPEIAFNKFLNVLNSDIREPYFVWIHIGPPHSPYLPPEPFKGMFDSSSKMRSNWDIGEGMLNVSLYHDPEDIETVRARYDEFIRYCDNQFEEFLLNLEKVNKIKNTVILLSSDHGETFDHNMLGHGQSLYEPETYIPLVIKEPHQPAGKVIDDLVEQVDIPATILELANIKVPLWMEGRSLVPLMRGEHLADKHVFSMALGDNIMGSKLTKGTIAVWEGDYKLIYHIEQNKSQLFNIRQDRDEFTNLFDEEKELGNSLLSVIKKNLTTANEKIKMGE